MLGILDTTSWDKVCLWLSIRQGVLDTTSWDKVCMWLSTWQGILDTTLWDKACLWLATGQWFSTGTPVTCDRSMVFYWYSSDLWQVNGFLLVLQWLATGQWFSPGPPVSSTNKCNHHIMTEIDGSGIHQYTTNNQWCNTIIGILN